MTPPTKSALAEITEIEPPTYKNNLTVFTLAGVPFTPWKVVKAALAARLNIGLYGEQGMGKSQLFADVRSLAGNEAVQFYGRNDLDVKVAFRRLGLSKVAQALKEGTDLDESELIQMTSAVYKPLILVEEINRSVEMVQNQHLSLMEGFLELGDGKRYVLGGGKRHTFHYPDGETFETNTRYSVGLWTANSGTSYTGTSTMDPALKGRTHLILDVDNFDPENEDLDEIVLNSGGEPRLKEADNPKNRIALFEQAYLDMLQRSFTPQVNLIQEEVMLFRYLVKGLNYIDCAGAEYSKRKMKSWPRGAEEKNIGTTEEEKYLYRVVQPASVRGALSILTFARALREYARAENPRAKPNVLDSVVESMVLMGAYIMLGNPQQISYSHFVSVI
ncbi:MAG: hypothetical protein AABX04_05160 [Nanoarchaeota archaeon]